MIYKYFIFFFAHIDKKCDRLNLGGHYISASLFVGLTIAVNIFVVTDIFFMLFLQNVLVYDAINEATPFLCLGMGVLTFFYINKDNRCDMIYAEISQSSARDKIIYGICCLFYVVFSYGLWYMCNDIICVLKTGHGLSYAEEIVKALRISYW